MTKNSRVILWWAIAIVALAGLVYGLAKLGASPDNATLKAALTPDGQDHATNPGAPVTLVEYSDFQCPACGAYYPVMKELKEKAGDKLNFVYRNFPLRLTHRYAQIAAQAAEAAALQGKYWEMHDLLFERQASWPKASDVKQTMIEYAVELKLDQARFATDLESQAVIDRVQRDVESGNKIRVSATPTFYLNTEQLSLPVSVDSLLDRITALSK